MKKVVLVVLVSSFAIFTAYSQSGVIRELSGEVELKPAGASAFTPARAGSQVSHDTVVSTGFKSTAIIEIGSNVITVRPLTRLSMSEIQSSANTENLNINLQAGRIRVDVKPPAGTKANTTVQSPSATASVRGTSFDMDTKNLSVFEGRVAWKGSSGTMVSVSSGSTNTITSDGGVVVTTTSSASNVLPPSPVGTSATGRKTGSGKAAPQNAEGNDAADGSVDIEIGYGLETAKN